MQNIGVIIGRFSPLHIGHISLINLSIKSNDKTIIIIGSANKIDEKNPFSIEKRKDIIFKEFGENIIIEKLNDYKSDKYWIGKINSIIKKYGNENDNINFLGGDLTNDYAIKVIKENLKYLDFKNISFLEKNRNEIPISATEVRKIIKEKNLGELKKWLSKKTSNILIK